MGLTTVEQVELNFQRKSECNNTGEKNSVAWTIC